MCPSLQVEQRRREHWREQQRLEQEEAGLREGLRLQEEELQQETERMVRRGYEDRVRDSALLRVNGNVVLSECCCAAEGPLVRRCLLFYNSSTDSNLAVNHRSL